MCVILILKYTYIGNMWFTLLWILEVVCFLWEILKRRRWLRSHLCTPLLSFLCFCQESMNVCWFVCFCLNIIFMLIHNSINPCTVFWYIPLGYSFYGMKTNQPNQLTPNCHGKNPHIDHSHVTWSSWKHNFVVSLVFGENRWVRTLQSGFSFRVYFILLFFLLWSWSAWPVQRKGKKTVLLWKEK